jgi:hypothetical protein
MSDGPSLFEWSTEPHLLLRQLARVGLGNAHRQHAAAHCGGVLLGNQPARVRVTMSSTNAISEIFVICPALAFAIGQLRPGGDCPVVIASQCGHDRAIAEGRLTGVSGQHICLPVSAASTRLTLLTSISAGSATGAVCGPGTAVTLARGEPLGGLTPGTGSRAGGILKSMTPRCCQDRLSRLTSITPGPSPVNEIRGEFRMFSLARVIS